MLSFAATFGLMTFTSVTVAQTPSSLARASRPEPSNLGSFVQDPAATIALDNTLLWDMRVVVTSTTPCAS